MATPSSIRRVATSPSIRSQCLLHDTAIRATSTTTTSRAHQVFHRPSQSRRYSSAPYIAEEPDAAAVRPRWQSTPRGMTMPFRIRPRDKQSEWKVNSDPRRLDDFYVKLLGPGGDALLTEETKWLAITHKSFDQGKRGFNDRLSWFGKRILSMHTSLALLAAPPLPSHAHQPANDTRQPYEHPLLDSLPNLSAHASMLGKSRLSQLAKEHGLQGVLRWKPKKVDNLTGSGLDVVLAQSMYAIIGAVALERGGEVAKRVARERILAPLGLETTETS